MITTPSTEAITAAAIKPGDILEVFLVPPSKALEPVLGALVTVCVTILPLKVTTWTLVMGVVVGMMLDSEGD
jgi:hypothetical protein